MNILVTGANGFVGKNLCAELANIRDGKAHYDGLSVEKIYQYDIDSTEADLDNYCRDCDFVFNFAGVNRPKNQEEFMQGNRDFFANLLELLKRHNNLCPVMLASSQQASLSGRFGNSEYGRSKKASEELLLAYAKETGAIAKIYRFPNVFGKWCRPNYNSAVATFCNNIANNLPIHVSDPAIELELLYIDDLVAEMIACLAGKEHRCEYEGLEVIPQLDGGFCFVPVSHHATLGQIVDLLKQFHKREKAVSIPQMPNGSFEKKLFSTYLSYLPADAVPMPLKMNIDARGSFTELLHLQDCGQVSVNISKPGITKGQHWHHSKWEYFIVVKGHGLIQERKIGSDYMIEYEVSGDKIEAVAMLPGYTHNIINLSDTEDLVTVMYCNEQFDAQHPDTYSETV